MVRVYIAIGSNMGTRSKNIDIAIERLGKLSSVEKVSSIYETEPVGFKNQNWFLNCAIEIVTSLAPKQLLMFTQVIESALGRTRSMKNGPRAMDLDILFYDSQVISEAGLGSN